MHAIASFRAGLIAWLKADYHLHMRLGDAMYEALPKVAAPPFIELSGLVAEPADGTDAQGLILRAELRITTRERGGLDAFDLAAFVRDRLEAGPIPLDGQRLVSLAITRTRHAQDAAKQIARVDLSLRAFLEPL